MHMQQNNVLPVHVILAVCWLMMVSILLATSQVGTDLTCLGKPHLLI